MPFGAATDVAYIEVKPAIKGWDKTVRGTVVSPITERAGRDAGTKAGGAFRSGFSKATHAAGALVKGVLGGAAIAGGALLGTALTKGFSRLQAIDDARAKLTGLGNSAKQTDAIMKNALASVKGTAFGMDEAATTAAGAVAAGVKPGKDLQRTLSLTADAATIAGVSMADMGSIFNKVATSNKIQGDTIAQLSDQGIPVVQLLSKEMGKSSDEVVKLASAGKINFATFQNAMEKGLGGAAQSSGKTFTGAMKNIQASLGRIGAGLLGGIFPHLAPTITQITKGMEPLEEKSKVIGDRIGVWLGKGLQRVPGIINGIKQKWAEFQSGMKDGQSFTTFQKLGNWAGIAQRNLSPLVTKVKSLFSAGKGGGGAQLTGLLDKLKNADWSALGESLKNIGSQLGKLPALGPVVASGVSLFSTALGFAADHAGLLAKVLPVLVGAFVAYKLAQVANQTIGRQSVVGFWAQTAATFALAGAKVVEGTAIRGATRAAQQNAVATGENTAATNTGILATVRQRVAAVASAIAQRTVAAATRAWSIAQAALNAVMAGNPIALVIIGIVALAAAVVLAYKKSETFRNIVNGAFGAVKATVAVVVGWFTRVFVPFFTQTIPNAFRSVLNFARAHWPLILGILTGPIGLAVGLVVKYWGRIKGAFSSAVAWAKGTFNKLWSGVSYVLTHPISAAKAAISKLLGATGLQSIFSGARDAIGRIWGGLKEKITSPITSVMSWIRRHFIDPINSMLGTLHIGFKIPWPQYASGTSSVGHGGGHVAPSRAYANGTAGVLPGYSPGTDNMHFWSPQWGGLSLSGGEGIARPEVVRAMGTGMFNALNAAARSGGVGAVRKALGFASGGIMPHHSYGVGGLIDWGKGLAGDFWSGIKKIGGFAVDMAKLATDPAGTLKSLATKLLGGIASNPWGQVLKGSMLKAVSGLVEKVKGSLFGGGGSMAIGGSGSGAPGSGWRWMWNLIHSRFPDVSLTSAYRPGARTAGSGQVSMHALGRAIDLGGSVSSLTRVARWIAANYGSKSADLLYSPLWGNMGIYRGHWYPQPAITVAQHGNHVHWGYGRGGVLPKAQRPARGYWAGTSSAFAGPARVAENGPEIVYEPSVRNFRGGERVVSARRTQRELAGLGGGPAVQATIYAPSDKARQIVEELSWAVRTNDLPSAYGRP